MRAARSGAPSSSSRRVYFLELLGDSLLPSLVPCLVAGGCEGSRDLAEAAFSDDDGPALPAHQQVRGLRGIWIVGVHCALEVHAIVIKRRRNAPSP